VKSAQLKLLLLALASFAVGALAVSNQSFWIDEGAAAIKAVQPTLASWWSALVAEGHSNLQLLPHLFLLWGWEKIFGSSEVALRALNVPLLFGGLAAAHWGLRDRPQLQFWFPVLALVNAFTWYYTNEARPYILLFATACIPLACLLRAFDRPEECRTSRTWFVFLCAGTFLVAATSLIAVPWAGAWLLAALVLIGARPMLNLAKEQVAISCTFVVAMVVLGGYYLWTLSLGAGASRLATTDMGTLAFVLYEQAGLQGIGPGRNELRAAGWRLLQDYALPFAVCLALLLPLVWQIAALLRTVSSQRRVWLLLAIAVVLPLATVLCAGAVMHVRILGRHLATFYPVVLFTMAVAMQRLVQPRAMWRSTAAAGVVAVLLFSSLQIRFAPRHFRDDYRSAAAVARTAAAEQRIVWWAADGSTGTYYGVPLAGGGAHHLISPEPEPLAAAPAADVIVLSKPDVYDLHGSIRRHIAEEEFVRTATFQSFEVFERPQR
jgi:hypothetical protein